MLCRRSRACSSGSRLGRRAVTWQRLPGGLCHHIYRVGVDGEAYVAGARTPVSAAGLGIPPDREVANTVLAAATGAGAQVFEVLPDVPAIVIEFIPGRTLGIDDVRRRTDAADRDRLPALHAGGRSATTSTSSPSATSCSDCARHDLPLPAGYHDHTPTVERSRGARTRAAATVPCHNDLLAENFIARRRRADHRLPTVRQQRPRVRAR